jgi:general secretion pathway protein E/type IV pilus assembly protein PilB
MSENRLITDVTELIDIKESSQEIISSYLADRPNLHALVADSGDVYYVQNNKIRLLKQLLRLIEKITGKQPNTIEITESVYQSFLFSKQEIRAEISSISPNREVEELLVQAINLGVSDIHLHAWQSSFIEGASADNQNVDNVASSWIRFRKHQILLSAARISYDEAYGIYRAAFTGEPYGRSNIDDRRGNDASFQYPYRGENYLVRLASLPDARGISMTFRIRNAKESAILSACGYSEKQLGIISKFVRKNGGLLIIGGPTNSGKSTTLTGLLAEMTNKAILSYEDPVEVLLPYVSHIQLRRDVLDPEQDIRELMLQTMRMDPDVINVGELRDELMVSFAKEKATEGKLTTGTTHCGKIVTCLTRLIQLGINADELAAPDTLIGVIAQKLVPVTCQECALPMPSEHQIHSHYQKYLGGNIKYRNIEGCEACNYSGITGQTLVSEAIEINRSMRELIAKQNWNGIIDYFWDNDIDTLHIDALKKIQRGILDPQIVEQHIDRFDRENLRHLWGQQKTLKVLCESNSRDQEKLCP